MEHVRDMEQDEKSKVVHLADYSRRGLPEDVLRSEGVKLRFFPPSEGHSLGGCFQVKIYLLGECIFTWYGILRGAASLAMLDVVAVEDLGRKDRVCPLQMLDTCTARAFLLVDALIILTADRETQQEGQVSIGEEKAVPQRSS